MNRPACANHVYGQRDQGAAEQDSNAARRLGAAPVSSNLVLARAQPSDIEALASLSVVVDIKPGERLLEAGDAVNSVYFVERGLLTTVSPMSDDLAAVTRVIGCEAVVGLGPALAKAASPDTVCVLSVGAARRIEASQLRHLFHSRRSFAERLLGHLARDVSHLQHDLGCACYHTAEQRFCRLVLMLHADSPGEVVKITQEEIASLLGVQRTTVTMIAHKYKASGAVAYNRGLIRVLSAHRLEAAACSCDRHQATPQPQTNWYASFNSAAQSAET